MNDVLCPSMKTLPDAVFPLDLVMEGDTCPAAPSITLGTPSPKSPPQSPTANQLDEKVTVSPKSERVSPEPNCAICLGKSENKSFTDSCLHQFCFKCLLEWSKVKAECPLCKQHFKSIIHNVRSNEDYDQYHLRPADTPYPSNMDFLRRFSYRTTLTPERRRDSAAIQRLVSPIIMGAEDIVIPSQRIPSYGYSYRRRRHATSEFRQHIYLHNLWVDPLPDITGRYRESAPEFYRMNPAQMHRLVPWLNRELNVLVTNLLRNNQSQVVVLVDIILGNLTRHAITSEQFRSLMSPHIGCYTTQFIHEFNSFARSPYDMIGFDESAIYIHRSHFSVDVDSSSSSDSDVILLSPEPSTSQVSLRPRRINEPLRTEANITVAHGSPVSPVAGPSGSGSNIMLMLSEGFRNQMFSDIDSTSSGTTMDMGPQTSQTERVRSDPEECMIVGYVKPRHERTPEVITLDSDPDVGPHMIEEGEVTVDNISVVSSKEFSDCLLYSNSSSSSTSSGSEYIPYERAMSEKKAAKNRSFNSKSQRCSKKYGSAGTRKKVKRLDSTSSSSLEREYSHKRTQPRHSRKLHKKPPSSDSSCEDDKSWSRKITAKSSKKSRLETWRIKSRSSGNRGIEEDHDYSLDCAGPSYAPPYTATEISSFTEKSRPKLRSIVITRTTATENSRELSYSPVPSSSRSSHCREESSSRSSSRKQKHKSHKRDGRKSRKVRRSSSSSPVPATQSSKSKRQKRKKNKKLFSSSSSESS